jgi:uncharacterized protein
MKIGYFGIIIAMSALSSFSTEESNLKLANELVRIVTVDNQIDLIMNKLTQIFEEKIHQINVKLGKENDSEVKKQSKHYVDTLMGLFRKEIERQNFSGQYAKTYSEVYTEEELKELLQFYKSPIGKQIAEKNSMILFKEMEMMQKMNDSILPLFQTKAEEILKGMLMPNTKTK